jgi:hypothetical protein
MEEEHVFRFWVKYLPKLGEELPSWWLRALDALQVGNARESMSKSIAIKRIRRAICHKFRLCRRPKSIWTRVDNFEILGRPWSHFHIRGLCLIRYIEQSSSSHCCTMILLF